MGSTRTTIHQVACPCGKGAIVTDEIEYDNGWSRDGTDTRLACPACEATYELTRAPAYSGPGYVLELKSEMHAHTKVWREREELGKLIDRDYCRPVEARLIELARANEGAGGKRKAWLAALSKWDGALNLPPEGAAWQLESFLSGRVTRDNVARIAHDLELASGLDERLAELARLDEAYRSRPKKHVWDGTKFLP